MVPQRPCMLPFRAMAGCIAVVVLVAPLREGRPVEVLPNVVVGLLVQSLQLPQACAAEGAATGVAVPDVLAEEVGKLLLDAGFDLVGHAPGMARGGSAGAVVTVDAGRAGACRAGRFDAFRPCSGFGAICSFIEVL